MFIPDEATTKLLQDKTPHPMAQSLPTDLGQKIWFFQRENGQIETVDETAAWHMFHPAKVIKGRAPVYKLIGVSYGDEYIAAIKEATKIKLDYNNADYEEKLNQRKAIIKDGLEKAIEAARGHIEMPRNPNMLDINGKMIEDPVVLSYIKNRPQ